jgi:hypothetical protein
VLRLHRERGDPRDTVRLSWTGGFPSWDLHRAEVSEGLRSDDHELAGNLRVMSWIDDAAGAPLLFYSVDEFP